MGVQKVINEIDKIITETSAQQDGTKLLGMQDIFPLCKKNYQMLHFPEFLPALWQGQMSAPKSRYGEEVTTLRNSLMESLIRDDITRTQTCREFSTRISDVWNAVKKENFIFAFQNSQAVEVYRKMEEFFDRETTDLYILKSGLLETVSKMKVQKIFLTFMNNFRHRFFKLKPRLLRKKTS